MTEGFPTPRLPAGDTLDVRLAREFQAGHFASAFSCPLEDLASSLHLLPPRDRRLWVFADDAELRPELMRRTIIALQDAGVEPDIWKIEGVEERSDAEMLVEATRRDGRDGVVSVLLGRGASDAKVDHWLEQAAPVDGFVGFAIGRSIWWDALKGFLVGALEREAATDQVADNYLRFIKVYEQAEQGSRVG